jgi:hypothetical protein
LFPSDYGLIMRMKRYGDGYILHLRRKDAVWFKDKKISTDCG